VLLDHLLTKQLYVYINFPHIYPCIITCYVATAYLVVRLISHSQLLVALIRSTMALAREQVLTNYYLPYVSIFRRYRALRRRETLRTGRKWPWHNPSSSDPGRRSSRRLFLPRGSPFDREKERPGPGLPAPSYPVLGRHAGVWVAPSSTAG
jgi:hypothetical protein